MNKIISTLAVFVFFSCIAQKNVLDSINNNNSTFYIENNHHLIVFRFNISLSNEITYNKSFIRKDKNTIIFVGEKQLDEISVGEYHFTFISNKKDTMHIAASIGYNNNFCFDKMKFKKGKYRINYILNDIIYKPIFKGNKIFINNKTFLNTKIIRYKTNYFSQTRIDTIFKDTIMLKNLKFSYYNYKQKDFILIKE